MNDRASLTAWVASLDGGYASYAQEAALLGAAGYELRVFDGPRHDRAGKLRFAEGAAGVFVRWTELDDDAFAQMPSVRYVVRYGVGFDNVDLDAASRRGIAVCNVQGYANHAVSDHALALLLACLRRLREGRSQLLDRYTAPPAEHMLELRELTVGIVGLGRIGGVFCTKIRPLVREVLACDPYIPTRRFAELGATPCALDELLTRSNAISIHCNLTPETQGMVNEDAFGRMADDTILVNTARGPIIDEEALFRALVEDRLGGAGLDVFHDEPPLANRRELLEHPRVEATGHYAWYSNAAARELQRRAGENMVTLLSGGIPEDCLNGTAVFP